MPKKMYVIPFNDCLKGINYSSLSRNLVITKYKIDIIRWPLKSAVLPKADNTLLQLENANNDSLRGLQ